MAETKNPDEPALSSAKRKLQLTSHDQENLPLKSHKLRNHEEAIQAEEGNFSVDNHRLDPRSETEEPGIEAKEEEEEEEEDDGYDEDEEDEDDGPEEGNGNPSVDRKGKGILLEEEKDSDDDDEDDYSDGGNETEDESDLSDDPLAEVDLDNILPSRTRRRVVQPVLCIAKNVGNNGEGDDGDT